VIVVADGSNKRGVLVKHHDLLIDWEFSQVSPRNHEVKIQKTKSPDDNVRTLNFTGE
jgi:hypothetical protein